MEQKTIMIVDDNQDFLEELDELLQESGYRTEVCASGKCALEKVNDVHPDLILLDMKMPEVSGFQVADKIHRGSGSGEIPIVAMTGYYTEKEHRLLMNVCGVRECLTKPFHPLDVIAVIERELKKDEG
ncbi:MAG: response regulator [Candidatus Omnitrophica bacterium]|nr:response regulator [Candidatus Omnitrophota bacterium]